MVNKDKKLALLALLGMQLHAFTTNTPQVSRQLDGEYSRSPGAQLNG